MIRIGLKLFSINDNYVNEALRLYKSGICEYFEIYAFPASYKTHIHLWKDLNVPYIIHAPHFKNGMNLANPAKEKSNRILADEAFQFADDLKAKYVIFHPGVEGQIKETARQINLLNDPRILIENKPNVSVDGKFVCTGHSPEEIDYVVQETGAGHCLDIGHCICSANSKKIKPLDYVRRFIELKPALFHLTDGDINSPYDRHDHYGEGSYPIAEILKMIPEDASITNEAVKNSQDNLNDFVKDVEYLRNLL